MPCVSAGGVEPPVRPSGRLPCLALPGQAPPSLTKPRELGAGVEPALRPSERCHRVRLQPRSNRGFAEPAYLVTARPSWNAAAYETRPARSCASTAHRGRPRCAAPAPGKVCGDRSRSSAGGDNGSPPHQRARSSTCWSTYGGVEVSSRRQGPVQACAKDDTQVDPRATTSACQMQDRPDSVQE